MIVMKDNLLINRILRVVKKHRHFLITGHARADGDCLGSELSLARMLSRMGKKVRIINPVSIGRELLFLPGAKQVEVFREGDKLPVNNIEVIFIVDSGGLGRLEEMEESIRGILNRRNRPFLINIDHHPSNGNFGDINWVDYKRSSVGEMVYLLIKQSGIKIDKEIATNLYVSLDTDTGHFCFSSTTPMSHLIAAELIRKGVKIREVYKKIYEEKTLGEMKLLIECLKRARLALKGKVVWSVLTREMYRKYKATPSDSQNYLSFLRTIKGVRIALLFRETEKGRLLIKVSIRAEEPIDADKLVRPLGGGGHHRAAGLTLNPPLKKAYQQLINHIKNFVTTDPYPALFINFRGK
ncbi:MAG: bifunctional oligoribonuclease/PAP phosphatase NrnA [Planctomycetota bacterium]|nr:bifunctional oligoribonuclease/PAP phosphatase NrnA [Planctomycetota bacterium]MDI6788382.1 bifunctional oligoribonuclease/PAP phosphatase NrnA [Planctomycetota bacterium]